MAYGVLAYKCSYPDGPLSRRLDQLEKGEITKADAPNLPPAFFEASPALIVGARELLDQPIFQTALAAFLPEDAVAMEPLFSAITHGCLAGRQDECFNEVYWPRIVQGDEKFATAKLGLYGQDLAAVASFFTRPFAEPSGDLNQGRQALVLSLAGFALRAIGRLPDAVEPFREYGRLTAEAENWEHTAIGHGNLSELLLTLGQLADGAAEDGDPPPDQAAQAANAAGQGALSTAARAVDYADQSGDWSEKMFTRASNHGAALLASGDPAGAEARFREAEQIQAERQPGLPKLYSLAGFLYGDLLLARGRAAEVAERAEYALNAYRQFNAGTLLDWSLDQLNQARAEAAIDPTKASSLRSKAFSQAIEALQKANHEEMQARGHLAQAEALLQGEEAGGEEWRKRVEANLTEAETIATRGSMQLFLADALLLRSRLEALGSRLEEATDFRDQAAKLIRKHHYGRRLPDLAVLDAELDPAPETFAAACDQVAEGWWFLIPRLERLASLSPDACDPARVAELRRLETEYNTERDAYLAEQEQA